MSTFPTSWEGLLADLVNALKDAYNHRNDATYWSAQIESGADPGHVTKSNVTIVSVGLEVTGFSMTVKDAQGVQTTWFASPGANGHPIKFNGTIHNEASLIFKYAGSPINPVRFHLDIRWIKDGGQVMRLDTEFPKNP